MTANNDFQAAIDAAVQAIRQGDREAYRVIIEACETRMRVRVAPLLPDQSTAEDVVQQAFVTAYRKLDQYQVGTDFMGWIATIARYEALNERRRWFNERALKRRYVHEARIEQASDPERGDLGYGCDDPELITHLHQCIDSLRDRASKVLRDHYFNHIPNEKIAEEQGRTTAWVRVVLQRARFAIADCLKYKVGEAHG